MNIRIQLEELTNKLSWIMKAVPSKPTVSIFRMQLFVIKDDKFYIRAGKEDLSATILVNEWECNTEGEFCVDARYILAAISLLPAQMLTLQVDDKNLTVIYSNGRFSVALCADEYPDALRMSGDEYRQFSIKTQVFQNVMDYMKKICQFNELRPALNNICIKLINGGIDFAATDGFKLGRIYIPNNNDKPDTILIPMAITALFTGKHLSGACVCFDDEIVDIDMGGCNVIFKRPVFVYPNYEKVIPEGGYVATFDKKSFLGSIKRILVYGSITCRLNASRKEMMITAEDVDTGQNITETIECECEQDLSVTLDAGNILCIVSPFLDMITMYYSEPSRPIVLRQQAEEQNITALLMPIYKR